MKKVIGVVIVIVFGLGVFIIIVIVEIIVIVDVFNVCEKLIIELKVVEKVKNG